MSDKIKFQIKTLSNLFIGGAPAPFEIGGIDQYTVTDQYNFPYIPASSIKGALANIIREDDSPMATEIAELYRDYLHKIKAENQEKIQEIYKDEAEALKRIEDRYRDALADKKVSEYLFGISGFNNTPKLLFSDLLLKEEYRNISNCFSIDMKTSINNTEEKRPESNPRSYKTARSGLVFEGAIRLHKIKILGEDAEKLCETFIINNLFKFNEGIYRLGNSKSRGYGKIEVHLSEG